LSPVLWLIYQASTLNRSQARVERLEWPTGRHSLRLQPTVDRRIVQADLVPYGDDINSLVITFLNFFLKNSVLVCGPATGQRRAPRKPERIQGGPSSSGRTYASYVQKQSWRTKETRSSSHATPLPGPPDLPPPPRPFRPLPPPSSATPCPPPW